MYTTYSSYPSSYSSYSSASSAADAGVAAAMMGFLAAYWLVLLAISVLMVISYWKIFTKAGEDGWKAIIPFYNWYILAKITGTPIWAFVLICIPCVNGIGWLIFQIISSLKLAKSFGKETGFGVGLMFLNTIFLPILAFGKAEYKGPAVD